MTHLRATRTLVSSDLSVIFQSKDLSKNYELSSHFLTTAENTSPHMVQDDLEHVNPIRHGELKPQIVQIHERSSSFCISPSTVCKWTLF